MSRFKKAGTAFALCAVLILPLVSCAVSDRHDGTGKMQMTEIYFDTVVDIEVWGEEDQSLLDGCRNICDRYEKMFSRTLSGSEISRINSAGGAPVQVSDETAALIERGLYYSEFSGGLFDISIAPLSKLWDIGRNAGALPDIEAIEEAKSHVNYKNIVIEGNTVTLKDPQAGIDLGAVAKGFVADRLKEYLISNGVRHALINLGGNVVAVGKKPDGKEFRIGIQKPFAQRNETLTAVEVEDRSVVSSGTYERYFKSGGKCYHHILNPKTGFPFENDLIQVSIISDSSLEGDCLSTTCFALGLKKGTALIDSLENIQAIFVTSDYRMHVAGGIEIRKNP